MTEDGKLFVLFLLVIFVVWAVMGPGRWRRGPRGFVLIELICICAVIALLAALWFPVFAAAREKARQATCQSNLRQLGAGFRMAVEDMGGRFPDAGHFERNPEGSWVAVRREYQIDVRGGVLWAYIRDTRVFRCPTYANPAAAAALSFSMNSELGLLPEAGVAFPTRCLLLIEEAETSARGRGLNDGEGRWREDGAWEVLGLGSGQKAAAAAAGGRFGGSAGTVGDNCRNWYL